MSKRIYFDGGSKPNPGKMECGIMLYDGTTYTPMVNKRLGHGTNNVAEWTALIWAMSMAEFNGWSNIEIIGDSQLVINQAKGQWQIKKPELRPFYDEFVRLNRNVRARLRHVPRDENFAGIYLEHGRL